MRFLVHEPIESFPVTDFYRGMRLDRFLQAMLPRMSRTAIQAAIAERVELASGASAKAGRQLGKGDVVRIGARPGEVPDEPIAPPPPLPVLAHGRDWLVVDKPGCLASTPGARRQGDDVSSLVGLPPAHRLDRGTSGCLLLSRHRDAARWFDLAFRAHRIGKEYVAMVEGVLPKQHCFVDAPLGEDPTSRVPGKVAVAADGAEATTEFDVLARFADRTLVRARPRTGRRHQIRVHLAHLGHPVVGDLLYGGDERRFIRYQLGQAVEMPPGLPPGRHLLHAIRLSFPEPGTDRRIEVAAPWPADFGLGDAAPALPPAEPADAARSPNPRPNAGTKRVRSRYSR